MLRKIKNILLILIIILVCGVFLNSISEYIVDDEKNTIEIIKILKNN